MQQVNPSQAIQNSQQQNDAHNQQGNGSESKEAIDDRIADFWEFMGQTFGYPWISQFGERPNEMWVRALRKLTREQLWEGVNIAIQQDSKFPPNLVEFVGYCTKGKPWNGQPNFNQGKHMPKGYQRPLLPGETMSAEEAREKLRSFTRSVKTEMEDVRQTKQNEALNVETHAAPCQQCNGTLINTVTMHGEKQVIGCTLCNGTGEMEVCA